MGFDQTPGDCPIEFVIGDQLDVALEFQDQAAPPTALDLTGYTFEAKVFIPEFDNPEGGFGGGGYIVGSVAATFNVAATDLEAGQLSIGLTETQTAALNAAQSYRWYFRWVDTDSSTRTVLSGTFTARIP